MRMPSHSAPPPPIIWVTAEKISPRSKKARASGRLMTPASRNSPPKRVQSRVRVLWCCLALRCSSLASSWALAAPPGTVRKSEEYWA